MTQRVKTTPPPCLWCGKPLRKKTDTLTRFKDEPAPTQDDKGHPCVVVSIRPGYSWDTGPNKREKVRYGIWCGQWGDYGDGKFCGQQCGFSWARKHAKR